MTRPRNVALAFVLGVASFASYITSARADDDDHNKQLAIDLFDSGVRKMQEGQCDQSPISNQALCQEARDAFKRAYAIYPEGLGALRNLAFVEEHLGLIASAARNFRELTRRAPLDPNPARRLWADFARKEAEDLAPRIPRLTIAVRQRLQGMTLLVDGDPLPEAGWGTALEVDPGSHIVRAQAPGYTVFEATVDLAEQDRKDLTVVLEKEAQKPAAAPMAPPRPQPGGAPLRIAPLIVTGVGGVTVGVGLVLGYIAIQKRKDACGDSQYCDPEGLESGRSVARASTIVTGIGLATVGGGLAWYFLSAPKKKERAATELFPMAGPHGAGIGAHGTF